MGAQPVGGEHRELGVGHADMHVEREGRLAPGEHAQTLVKQLVAGAAGHLDLVSVGKRVRAGHGRPQAQPVQLGGERGAQRVELGRGRADGAVHAGGELERAGVSLGAHAPGEPWRQRRQEAVD